MVAAESGFPEPSPVAGPARSAGLTRIIFCLLSGFLAGVDAGPGHFPGEVSHYFAPALVQRLYHRRVAGLRQGALPVKTVVGKQTARSRGQAPVAADIGIAGGCDLKGIDASRISYPRLDRQYFYLNWYLPGMVLLPEKYIMT